MSDPAIVTRPPALAYLGGFDEVRFQLFPQPAHPRRDRVPGTEVDRLLHWLPVVLFAATARPGRAPFDRPLPTALWLGVTRLALRELDPTITSEDALPDFLAGAEGVLVLRRHGYGRSTEWRVSARVADLLPRAEASVLDAPPLGDVPGEPVAP